MGYYENFEHLNNKVCSFYGVDNNKFKLDDIVWEGHGVEIDEYREDAGIDEVAQDENDIFFRYPVAQVKVVYVYENEENNVFDGYYLVDAYDGHVWLVVGCDGSIEWYPYFSFHYQAKEV